MERLQNIETFVRVAEAHSFDEAARQLHVARSVVTTRLKQIEEHVGAPLFIALLNPAGHSKGAVGGTTSLRGSLTRQAEHGRGQAYQGRALASLEI